MSIIAESANKATTNWCLLLMATVQCHMMLR